MAHVAGVAALEVGHPVALVVLMEADDGALEGHGPMLSRQIASGRWLSVSANSSTSCAVQAAIRSSLRSIWQV